jgi:hypothetical protein
MRIAIADENSRKFTDDIIKHWESLGHEVRVEPGSSEKLAQWADLYYIDSWTNNIHYLWKLYNDDPDGARAWMGKEWDNNKRPKMVCRILDWEAWCGFVRDQRIIDWVDKIIFIAPHIMEKVNWEVNIPPEKQRIIRPGVNLDKFTLKTKQTDGFQLGMVLGDEWKYKNLYGGLDIFTTLYQQDNRWRLHLRGQHESGIYDPENFDYYLKSRGIEKVVNHYALVDNMNDWYENIDILLHPGQKEAFCYAVGEAMAKGISCVINDFLGSHDIWREVDIYQTNQEAINILNGLNEATYSYNESIRDYIKNNYPLDRMLKEFDEYLNI